VEVKSLARPQVSEFTWVDVGSVVRTGFANLTDKVNGGQAFDLNLEQGNPPAPSVPPVTISIPANSAPADMVGAINAANRGLTARLVNTGSGTHPYKVVLTGDIGAANQFTLATADEKFAFPAIAGQAATDSEVVVDGVTFTRGVNVLSDVIPGTLLRLSATNTGNPATLEFSRDTTGLKEKAKALVTAYNDTMSDFKILSGPKSDDPEDVFSGSLQGDSTVRLVSSQVRAMMSFVSETGGENVSSLRDLGFSFDRSGVVSLDETAFDIAVSSHFDEVVSALSGSRTVNGELKRGVAATAVSGINNLMSPTGVVMSQSKGAENTAKRYQADLEKLEERMKGVLARYQKQFAVMESLVGNINSMRESLKGQFESLAAMYNRK